MRADQGEERQQRGPQRVSEQDDPAGQPSGAGGQDVVVAQALGDRVADEQDEPRRTRCRATSAGSVLVAVMSVSPPAGSQPRLSANTAIAARPIQNTGMDCTAYATARSARSNQPPRR